MRSLILIRGLSGSGQKTLASLLCADSEYRDTVCFEDYFIDEEGVYVFDPSAIKEAHSWCVEEAENLMAENEVVVVANCFTRKWECLPYFDLASKLSFNISIISLYDAGLNDSALSERCVNEVPPHVIQKQRQRWDLDVTPGRNNNTPRRPPPPPKYIPNPYYDWEGGPHNRRRKMNRY